MADAGTFQKKTRQFLYDRNVIHDGTTYSIPIQGDWGRRQRRDVFGLFDVLAAVPTLGIVGIQVCSRAGMAPHRNKALASPNLIPWLQAGGIFELWGWDTDGNYRGRQVLRAKVERLGLLDDRVCIISTSHTDDPHFYLSGRQKRE